MTHDIVSITICLECFILPFKMIYLPSSSDFNSVQKLIKHFLSLKLLIVFSKKDNTFLFNNKKREYHFFRNYLCRF